MDWVERKAVYNEAFFTEQCPIGSQGVADEDSAKSVAEWILSFCNSPGKVLDCGCAIGKLVLGFHETGVEIVGFDLSSFAIEHAIDAVKDHILLLDCALERLPYADGYFDLSIAFDFFEHQDDEHIETVIGEICRVTSGNILIRQPFTKFNVPISEREGLIKSFNSLSHKERLALIDNILGITTSVPDMDCPFHPQERGREFFIEKFTNFGFHEYDLDEDAYVFPNPASVCSFNCLYLERNVI